MVRPKPPITLKRNRILIWDEKEQDWDEAFDLTISKTHRPKSYEESVVTAGTAKEYNVSADLGRPGDDGWITNDHATNKLYIYISNDGTNYNGGEETNSTDKITIKANEQMPLTGFYINKLKIDASGNNTPFRVVVY